jgi:hypothetical protein
MHPPTADGRAVPCRRYRRFSRERPWPLAERADLIPCTAPGDPALARDLARAAAANPETTWCVTVTDAQGHAIGHGCARPEPGNHTPPANHKKPAPPPGHEPPRRPRPARPGREPHGRGIYLHCLGPARATRRLRLLAAHHRGPRAVGPDHRAGPDRSGGLRPPVRGLRPRPGGQAQAPLADPARHLHRADLPPSLDPLRFRAQHPVRSRRPIVPVQWRPQMPVRPPAQTAPALEGGTGHPRHLPLDGPLRPPVHHRTHPLPDMTSRDTAVLAGAFLGAQRGLRVGSG